MSLTYPDNDNREARIRELGTEIQDDLNEADSDYRTFQTLLKWTNPLVAQVYREAGLTPPDTSTIDVLKLQSAATDGAEATVSITKIVVDVLGAAGTLKYLAPGAGRFLVATGMMSEETAARVLVDFTLPLVGREISITAGDVASTVLGGVVGGVAIAGVDIAMDAIEGSAARDRMRDAIHALVPIRLATRVTRQRAATLVLSLTSVKTTMDALQGAGIPLTDTVLQNLITKDVQPSIDAEQSITAATVAAELADLDAKSGSWVNEDS